MKHFALILFSSLILLMSAFNVSAQNKKLDKSIKKIDGYYNAGSFEKALSSLGKFKTSALKLGTTSNYMVMYYLREAKVNLALGVVTGFEASLTNAANASQAAYGENSTMYCSTLLDISKIYLDYGNFRIAREVIEKSEDILKKSNQLTDQLKGRIALLKAEAMIGQGYANAAIQLLRDNEKYFVTRAVEKETIVEGAEIKTRRIPEEELSQRFNDYARLKMLIGSAIAKKGRIGIFGEDLENDPDVDGAFGELDSWSRGKKRLLGESSLIDVEYHYLWAKAFRDNGNKQMNDSRLQFDNILSDLKQITNPTNTLAHELYLSYLQQLLENGNRARYLNTKLEYEKVINKSYPRTSLHRVNLSAVEFNSKLSKDQTKDLENNALNLISTKSLPKSYRTTILIYEFLYDIAIAEQRYNNAETYLNELISIQKDLCGENTPQYHLAKVSLANFYLDYTNKIDEAGKIYQESYFNSLVKEIDSNHKDVINILRHIAQWYELTDKYSLAAKTARDAMKAAYRKYSNKDILLAMELDNIAKLQIKLGEYEEADQNILKSLEIIDLKENRDYKEWRGAYISALETQAKLFGLKGLFDDAESNLDRTRKLILKAETPIGDDMSTAKEMSSLFIQLGRYAATDKLLTNLISEYERLFGKSSMRLIEPLVDKGRILLAKGDYTEAEKTATRANQIANSIYGATSTKTAPTQKLLADIYYTLGDYDKSQASVTKALASQEKQFGRKHIEVAKSLSQLALIKFYKGDNRQEVEKLMLEARDIMAEKLGKDNPQYAEILKNVAVLYISERKFDIAFNALTVAEGIWKSKAGSKNNINTASIYTLTGDVYYQLKNYKRCEDFYNQAKDLYEKFFSVNHPEYVKVLSKLAKVYYMQKDFKRSKQRIEEALGNYENFIKQYFPALSEREKAKYWNTIKGDFEFYNTLAFSNLEDFRDLTKKVYDYQLLTKALLLSSSIKIRERILNSTDEALKTQYNNWIQKKELLTLALSMSPAQLTENEIDRNALQQEVERLEKDLSQKSEIFGQSFEAKRIGYEDVRKSLKPNEVAIEMVRYRYFNHSLTDSVIYAALYMKEDFSKPKAIIFQDGKRMEGRFFKYYRNAITGKIEDKISYGVFWKPIIDEIGQASTVYLSADGIFNQINLEAILTPDGRYVIDNSNIVLVSNTKDLYLRKIKSKQVTKDNTASMFGNPTFYLTASSESSIAALPGTEKEITQLDYILKEKGWITSDFVEQLATEEKVKELNSPKIFHIATHGLYRPTAVVTLEKELEGNEALMTQNPLMRTGLLLRGAGDLLLKTDYNYNMENGILTAYEAMSLNLDRTDLVVLSACETGLGDLEAGEGVYGLQRAFLVAGAKVLVMSMFKVDDDATQKLMLKFYQKWLNSNNLRQSFIDAKKELRLEYPDPIYWGAFMMIGLD
jgi:CHAT domain-containing protein